MTNQATSMETVLIAGGTGLIGMHLSRLLSEKGYRVIHLSRSKKPNAEFERFVWDVKAQTIDEEAVAQADYVINLAGAGIVGSRWTDARKKVIIDSRVDSAALLLSAISKLEKKPKAYIASSAIGYYGNTGEALVSETKGAGEGFLSVSCEAWENASLEAKKQDLRTVVFRTGIVLSTQGGALEKMLISFNFFIGAYFANGQQWYSWIHIDDMCEMYIQAIENQKMDGIYNGVAPEPARNKELIRQIGKAKQRPALLFPTPAFILRLIMGEMADTILYSQKVSAEKIQKEGFEFKYPQLLGALADLFKRRV